MTAISRRSAIAATAAAVFAGVAPAVSSPQKPRVEMQPDLGEGFTEAGTAGTFALLIRPTAAVSW